jgi:hypothetical protein
MCARRAAPPVALMKGEVPLAIEEPGEVIAKAAL